ncbi:MAG TPA: folylpolyglutamate synthase/dihydrofolate synthase family protein [Ktedonobacteraceae bacterium]|nr:folylpolyglutamate synthase/dihydrofolate synthase family protein [Ktedonobacteraceae bacterium]
MDYKEALSYIYSFTDYERGGVYKRDRNENMPRTASLLALLDNPHLAYSNTLVAGTKGKGSTSALIERVVREAGLKTGLYTQPDLHTFRERMRVNGQLISEQEVAELIPTVRRAVDQVLAQHDFGPFITYEIGTALAFSYFAHQHVQHTVVEVGVGGRLDATNLTQPLVSVITSISYDHMEVLGDTLTKIATEKAGIIKPDGIVVTSAQSPEALLAIAKVAGERHARLLRVGPVDNDPAQSEVDAGLLPPLSYRYREQWHTERGQGFSVQTPKRVYTNLEIPLVGAYQVENATAALATLEMLRTRGIEWDEAALRRGFQAVRWPARIEVVGHDPTMIVDGAHNADSMQKLMQALRSSFQFRRLLVVLGVKRSKDLSGMMRELAAADTVILTKMHNPMAADLEDLAKVLREYAPEVKVEMREESTKALDLARQLASPKDLICATGSLYLAAEALRWAASHGAQNAADEIEGVDH